MAHLAAILSYGHDIKNPHTLAWLANQSIAIWETCGQQRQKRIDILALYARRDAIKEEKRNLPRPKTFPITFNIFLRSVMPNKRPEDRAKCHREYVRQMFRDSVPTESEIEECMARDKQETIGSEGIYDLRADDFRRFLKEYEIENRRKRAQAGAIAAKRKRQKNGQAEKS